MCNIVNLEGWFCKNLKRKIGGGGEEHEILCSKRALKFEVNIQIIKVEKMHTHGLYI